MHQQEPHFNLQMARQLKEKDIANDFLIFNISDLTAMAFIASTSDIQPLRPIGVYLMKDIIEVI